MMMKKLLIGIMASVSLMACGIAVNAETEVGKLIPIEKDESSFTQTNLNASPRYNATHYVDTKEAQYVRITNDFNLIGERVYVDIIRFEPTNMGNSAVAADFMFKPKGGKSQYTRVNNIHKEQTGIHVGSIKGIVSGGWTLSVQTYTGEGTLFLRVYDDTGRPAD